MSEIIIRNPGNWTNQAISNGHKHKGVEYLRASLPITIYEAGIKFSGSPRFWLDNVTMGKLQGQSRAEAWMNRFKKFHEESPTFYTLLSIQVSPDTPDSTKLAQDLALAIEVRWITDNLL